MCAACFSIIRSIIISGTLWHFIVLSIPVLWLSLGGSGVVKFDPFGMWLFRICAHYQRGEELKTLWHHQCWNTLFSKKVLHAARLLMLSWIVMCVMRPMMNIMICYRRTVMTLNSWFKVLAYNRHLYLHLTCTHMSLSFTFVWCERVLLSWLWCIQMLQAQCVGEIHFYSNANISWCLSIRLKVQFKCFWMIFVFVSDITAHGRDLSLKVCVMTSFSSHACWSTDYWNNDCLFFIYLFYDKVTVCIYKQFICKSRMQLCFRVSLMCFVCLIKREWWEVFQWFGVLSFVCH